MRAVERIPSLPLLMSGIVFCCLGFQVEAAKGARPEVDAAVSGAPRSFQDLGDALRGDRLEVRSVPTQKAKKKRCAALLVKSKPGQLDLFSPPSGILVESHKAFLKAQSSAERSQRLLVLADSLNELGLTYGDLLARGQMDPEFNARAAGRLAKKSFSLPKGVAPILSSEGYFLEGLRFQAYERETTDMWGATRFFPLVDVSEHRRKKSLAGSYSELYSEWGFDRIGVDCASLTSFELNALLKLMKSAKINHLDLFPSATVPEETIWTTAMLQTLETVAAKRSVVKNLTDLTLHYFQPDYWRLLDSVDEFVDVMGRLRNLKRLHFTGSKFLPEYLLTAIKERFPDLEIFISKADPLTPS